MLNRMEIEDEKSIFAIMKLLTLVRGECLLLTRQLNITMLVILAKAGIQSLPGSWIKSRTTKVGLFNCRINTVGTPMAYDGDQEKVAATMVGTMMCITGRDNIKS